MKKLLCWIKDRPWLLLLSGFLLIVLLYLLRRWLYIWLILYLAILILLGLIGGVRFLQGVLRKKCKKAFGDPKGTGSKGHPPSKTMHLPPHTYKRPDPMIYSQYYLMSKGIAVTWNNPDIQLFDGITAVSSSDVGTNKQYKIRAQIWNGSVDAPAVNMLVRFYYLSFGVGTIKHYIGETFVDVPVKGAAGLPALAEHLWTTPTTAGHYCVQVELLWPDDANPDNNLGQENLNVKKLNSPNATFEFVLRNDSAVRRTFVLRTDAYQLPGRTPCPDRPWMEGRMQHDPYAPHRLSGHPFPAGWQIAFQPGDVIDLPAEGEQLVTVKVTAPDGFVGRQAINVNAFDGNNLVGGVTLYAES
ncbi:MAG TPA: hypothetical protein VFD75_09270 [Pyrinomonadaceae bacterium]|nr:hypothetical protein [Pyrinomonadaceae bacterium]